MWVFLFCSTHGIITLRTIVRFMAKILLQEKARAQRQKGFSIGQIATELQVSKSSVSYWCRNIVLSKSQINKIYSNAKEVSVRALVLAAEEKRKERIKNTELQNKLGQKEVGNLSKRDLFMVGLGLYWGEGYKSGNEELAFTNSDPGMIKLLIRWLKEIYGVNKSTLICRVSINQIHKERVEALINYWVKVTSIPASQFTKTSFIKANVQKHYQNHEVYFGVLRVKVRNGTNLRRRILGSIAKLKP